ncbi:glycosyltransferase family 25 protein [Pseudohoeflea suaedae]|nr:glycosyltransferase family 25 protein [Pseudohoeflea suaedae]
MSKHASTSANEVTVGDPGVYLINLDRAVERRVFMEEQFERLGIDHNRITAVDRQDIDASCPDFDAGAYARLHGRRFNGSEIACYLSHIEALRAFLKTGAGHALILEDDAKLPDDLADVMKAAIARSGEWDILRLSTVNDGIRLPYSHLTGKYDLAIALTREKGAAAYMVNRRCAERFIEKLLPIQVAWDIAFDLEYLHGLRSVFVEPPPVDQRSHFPTQIQNTVRQSKLPSSRYLTVFPFRAKIETLRFLTRGARLLALKLGKNPSGSGKPTKR